MTFNVPPAVRMEIKNYVKLLSFKSMLTQQYAPPRRRNSSRGLFDYQPKSGTAVAYDYAVRKKKEIINVLN